MTLAIRPAQATLLAGLRRAGRPRFVVIGATALHHHVPLRRQTADVDLAVVADPEEITAVFRSQRGWTPDPAHADRWKNGDERLDVVPASSALVEAGVVRFERTGKELSLVGFDLALARTVLVPVLDVEVEVAQLAALVVLKMIAWLDRPEERRKDLGDLADVLDRALPDFDERRWVSPLVDVDVESQSAFHVGRSVHAIAQPAHVAHVNEFLKNIGAGSWPSIFGAEGGYATEDVEAMAKRRLAAFRAGFSSATSPPQVGADTSPQVRMKKEDAEARARRKRRARRYR